MTKIEEEMCGKEWSIPLRLVTAEDGSSFCFSAERQNEDGLPMGDLAPRYWIPVVIGKQAPQTFWNELLKSTAPMPFDEGDLVGAKPWWERYQIQGGNFLKQCPDPVIKDIDPDESTDDKLARENDHGSNQHTANRKRTERAKLAAKRERKMRAQEKVRNLSPAAPPPERIKPGLNLYVRSAKPTDIPRIREIYNHYVDFTVCTPETTRRTDEDIRQRYDDVLKKKLPFLVACERGGKV